MADPYYDPLNDDDKEEYEGLPENAEAMDYVLHPFRSIEGFMKRIVHNFGWRFAVQIGVMYLLVKGLMTSVINLIRLSYCKKTLGIDGTACQTMGAIAQTPWAIKGAIGVISDCYPLFMFHKASYIIVTSVMGTVALAFLASIEIHVTALAAGFFFLINLQIATCDLLCEGKYAEFMQLKPKTGSTMVSYVWGCFQIGSLIAACFVGPVADHYNPQVIFWFMLPMAASIIVPTSLGYLHDKKVSEEKSGFDYALVQQYPYIVAFCLIMCSLPSHGHRLSQQIRNILNSSLTPGPSGP